MLYRVLVVALLATSAGWLTAADGGLRGFYRDNVDFTGALIERVDPTLDFAWGAAAPASGIAAYSFSVTWLGTIRAPAPGLWTIETLSDDGVEVVIDGKSVISNWTDHAPTVDSGSFAFEAGKAYPIRIRYYQGSGPATFRLSWRAPGQAAATVIPASALSSEWRPTAGTGTGLIGRYHVGRSLSGTGVERLDPTVSFSWGGRPPGPAGIPANGFSAEWVGEVEAPYDADYFFSTLSDDGVQLWIDDRLVIENWTDHGAAVNRGRIHLPAGRHRLRLRYYQATSDSLVHLRWSCPYFVETVVPADRLYPVAPTTRSLPTGDGQGASATLYPNGDFTGEAVERTAVPIAMDPSLMPEGFSGYRASGVWTARLRPYHDGDYAISVSSAGGVLVFLDGVLVINDWSRHERGAASTRVALRASQPAMLTVRWFCQNQTPHLRLWWAESQFAPEPIPVGQLEPVPAPVPTSLALATPTDSSLVDPVWIEGTVGGAAVSVVANGASQSVVRLGKHGWFATSGTDAPLGVRLRSDAPTPVTVTAAAGGVTQTRTASITWQPILLDDLPYGLERLTLRVGDRIRVGLSSGDAAIDTDYRGDALTPDVTAAAGSPAIVSWSSAGSFVLATRSGSGGVVRTLPVDVVAADLRGPIACQIGFSRTHAISWQGDASGQLVATSADDEMLVTTTSSGPSGAALTLLPLTSGSPRLLVRQGGAHGPVVAMCELDEFSVRCSGERTIAVIESMPDGTTLAEARLTLAPLVPQLDCRIWTIIAGVTLDDSTTSRQLSTSGFESYSDGRGAYVFRLIHDPATRGGYCHQHQFFQRGVRVSF